MGGVHFVLASATR
jgi:hypothetical protein